MSTKHKIVISTLSVVAVLMLAVVAVVAVLAADTQRVGTNVNINYTATQIEATVSANYYKSGGEKTAMTTSKGATSITFTANQTNSQAVGSLAPNETISLDGDESFVVYEYIFTNNMQSLILNVELESEPAAVNVKVRYLVSATPLDISEYDRITSETYQTAELAPQTTGYVYVRIDVDSLALDFSYNGACSWKLTRGDLAG